MHVVLDVENTVTERNGKTHFDPFEPTNELVQVGTLYGRVENIFTYNHSCGIKDTPERLQNILDKTTLLIGHNIVHDLMWLWECGFKYDGPVYDTMVAESVLHRGIKVPLSLGDCAERNELESQKGDTLHNYLALGYSVRDIPHDELSFYLSGDLHTTKALRCHQLARLATDELSQLTSTVDLCNRVTRTLARLSRNGIKVDKAVLDLVKQEYIEEKQALKDELDALSTKFMGDVPINLNSPEQVSTVIYSRKPIDKSKWPELFEGRLSKAEYRNIATSNTVQVYKKRAVKCDVCRGSGRVWKTKKDGSPFKKPNRCQKCDAVGCLFIDTPEVAGLKFFPLSKDWVTANGFATGKDHISLLADIARGHGMVDAENYLRKLQRLNAVESYLSTYVAGIENYAKHDGLLHVQLTQVITSTGRFSGRSPNMQNMPRGGTFPVKRCFVSRFEGGELLEADFAQLEFRVAAFLSQDATAMQEIEEGFDVHSYTAKVITDAGESTSRQDAKAHTFAPLYGATGYGRTPPQARYYEQFIEKYAGIAAYHKQLTRDVLTTGYITLPSKRQYDFSHSVRRKDGTPTHFTQIKNYPVQGFATGDIVPLILTVFDNMLEGMLSCIVNSVHDSIVIDIHPEEKEAVLDIVQYINTNLKKIIDTEWGIDINVPLLLEAKTGPNWLDMKEVA